MSAAGLLVGVALAVSVAGVAVLVLAVSRRWFARFRHGFRWSLMVALAGTGLAIAAVLGVWAYTEAGATLRGQIVSEMTHIAQIEQNEIKEDIADAQTSLQFFATRMAEDARRNPAAVRERLRELQAFDPRFLQVNLMDAEGRVLVSSSVTGDVEPPNRIGVAYTLEGKPFVSDIYVSPLFKRWVIYISAPVKGSGGVVTGAVSARFDMQEDLKAFVRTVRFGDHGYTMVANAEGRIIGHPDQARLNTDVSAYPVVRAALQGQTTSADQRQPGRHRDADGRPAAREPGHAASQAVGAGLGDGHRRGAGPGARAAGEVRAGGAASRGRPVWPWPACCRAR